MKSHQRVVKIIAKNNNVNSDDLLLLLWDYAGSKDRFSYIKTENSAIKKKDIVTVRTLIKRFKNKDLVEEISSYTKPVKITLKDYNFSNIGKSIDQILHITKEEILRIHKELVTDFTDHEDPIFPSGVKNDELLESALFHSKTSYEGKTKYSTIESAAAALMYSISQNHAFHNGNKRTAMVAMLVFLDRHHLCLTCDENELFRVSIKLAKRQLVEEEYLYSDAEIHELARWIHVNSKIMKSGERPITLKRFRQILDYFECAILENGRVTRTVKFFGFSKLRTSKKFIPDTMSEGSELDINLIKSIREDLGLNPENGIDSDTFYLKGGFSSSDFIIKYKNLLKRLSRV